MVRKLGGAMAAAVALAVPVAASAVHAAVVPARAPAPAPVPAAVAASASAFGQLPVIGYNNWYQYGAEATEADVLAQARFLVSRGLAAAGYDTVESG